MRQILLRIATTDEPLSSTALWRRASAEAHQMTPFAIAALADLIDEGLLARGEAGLVTVVNQRAIPEPADRSKRIYILPSTR